MELSHSAFVNVFSTELFSIITTVVFSIMIAVLIWASSSPKKAEDTSTASKQDKENCDFPKKIEENEADTVPLSDIFAHTFQDSETSFLDSDSDDEDSSLEDSDSGWDTEEDNPKREKNLQSYLEYWSNLLKDSSQEVKLQVVFLVMLYNREWK